MKCNTLGFRDTPWIWYNTCVTRESKNILAFAAPFATWIGLQTVLPATAGLYALRSLATLAALLFIYLPRARAQGEAPAPTPSLPVRLGTGLLGGLLVFVLWVGPEYWIPARLAAFYRTWCCWPLGSLPAASSTPSPYEPAVCGWPLTLAKLAGSAFIIAPAEEIFFRSFLYRWLQQRDFRAVPRTRFDASAFVWMTVLFMLEHDRPLAAAAAAGVYGLVYLRCGLVAASVAHMLTNLLLALYVIKFNLWNFW